MVILELPRTVDVGLCGGIAVTSSSISLMVATQPTGGNVQNGDSDSDVGGIVNVIYYSQ